MTDDQNQSYQQEGDTNGHERRTADRGQPPEGVGGAQRSRHPQAVHPGCETLEMQSPTDMTARVKLAVGPVRATFSGKVKLTDIDPPNGYRIVWRRQRRRRGLSPRAARSCACR